LRVDEQMALTPGELLGPVVAARATNDTGFDRLAIADGGVRLGAAPAVLAGRLA
jgi:hypothetical protein